MSLQAAPEFPALSGRVVDQARLLSDSTERQLTSLLAEHEQKTSNQVVVVTLGSLQGYDIAEFGYQLGRHWAIGQEGKDNGVLLIVAPNERKARIEVGYGLEGTLTDALSTNIIESEITPRFKQGDMEGGILAGTRAILGTIEGSYRPDRSQRPGTAVSEDLFNFFGTAVFISLIFAGMVRRMIGNRLLASLVMGGIAWLIGTLIFSMALGLFSGLAVLLVTLLTGLGGGGRGGGGGYYGGYYGGGYSSGGGFGGFSGGGGGFGGGGASGGW